MRTSPRLAAFVVLTLVRAVPSYGESETDHELKQWRREIARECPAKHLGTLSLADMFAAVDAFKNTLPLSDQGKLETRARSECVAGLGCVADSYVFTIQNIGKLRSLVKSMCQTPRSSQP
jgi:hypothetical protein